MSFLDTLDRHFGKFAIPHLMRYIVGFNALVYLLLLLEPGYGALLTMDRELVLRGEVWRVVTWIFLPNTLSPLWIIFYLLFTWWLGEMLEGLWGTFRLNAYYLTGYLASTAAAFIFGASGGNYLLVLTLLLAVATLAPEEQVLLLVFPVKIKWIAIFSLVIPWGLYFLIGPIPLKAMIVVCLGNYLLFFGVPFLRHFRENRENAARLRKFRVVTGEQETLHRCAKCGITEVSHPHAEFRVASDGQEYCGKHLPG